MTLSPALITPYACIASHEDSNGYIVWRRGTGDNVELLHLRATEDRAGCGRNLFTFMLASLLQEPPYYSVFGFTRTCNLEAQRFYEAMGFELSYVKHVYADGNAVLFSQEYKTLCRLCGIMLEQQRSNQK